jgi:hypothetical protein
LEIRAYQAYIDSGAYHARFGSRGLRVLTVTTSPARLANLKRIPEEVGGRSRFWFTTMPEVTPETVLTEAIWAVAGRDDRHALVDVTTS